MFEFSSFDTPTTVADTLVGDLHLTPGVTCTLEIRPGWKAGHAEVTLRFDRAAADAKALTALKRLMTFEVPSWALGYGDPELTAETIINTLNFEIRLHICINGAYTCEQVGTEEVPPSQSDVEHSRTLASMTPEEALAHVQAEAIRLATPRTKAKFRCRPVR